MSHVMATCLCYFPSLGLFFSLPLRQLHQLMGFAYRQFQETTICLLLNVINTEYVYTHTQMLILIISFCDWYRWGWSKCIGYADSKLREKHIRKYRRSALCIAVPRFICHMHRERVGSFSSCPLLPFSTILTI